MCQIEYTEAADWNNGCETTVAFTGQKYVILYDSAEKPSFLVEKYFVFSLRNTSS